jgi:hypothetical protein
MGLISVITGATASLLGIEGQSNAQCTAPSAIAGDIFARDLLPHRGLVVGWWEKNSYPGLMELFFWYEGSYGIRAAPKW